MKLVDSPTQNAAAGQGPGAAAREGEVALPFDPGIEAADGRVMFIGRISSPWQSREECPRNMAAARQRGRVAQIVIDEPFRPGLLGLEGATHLIVLSWFDRAVRNLILQKPRHASEPKGVFALRSPVRPNPIGLHVVRVTALDAAAGLITVDAIDVLDGTPVLDVKPYFASTDAFPDAGWCKT